MTRTPLALAAVLLALSATPSLTQEAAYVPVPPVRVAGAAAAVDAFHAACARGTATPPWPCWPRMR